MSINERLKYFRKMKRMNQKQFAEILGVTQSGISHMEQEGAIIADSSIKAICLAYGLNENWLRYGTEPMYPESDTFNLSRFIKEHEASELELEIMKAYFSLDSEIRTNLINHFKNHFENHNRDAQFPQNSPYDGAPATPEELERLYPPVNIDTKNAG
ncbi:MAG: helix-turn-helix transcriptional regulator [Anaeroplasmataceae bacterium]|nr:helix-turn-helix transcriptional regulator [Anaeroplasmataceae bacterium]